MKSVQHLQQTPCNTCHRTFVMLLHYLEKLKRFKYAANVEQTCVTLTFLASFTVLICFDFCTSHLRSSCCLRTSSLYDVFVLRSVNTLLVSIWHDKPVVAGHTSRHCFATVQCAKIRRCDETGDFTVWTVTPP